MRFSIILPTRDRPEYLQRAIASVLAQPLAEFQLVIYDNGTEPVPRSVIPADPRIIYKRGPASGPCDAFNRALFPAIGEIIHPLGDDDQLASDALEIVDREIGEAEWLVARTQTYDERGEPLKLLGRPPDPERMAARGFGLGGAVYFRRRLLAKVNPHGFDPAYDHAGDYDLYLRFARVAEAVFLDRVLYLYTNHPGVDSRVNRPRQRAAAERIRRREASKGVDAAWLMSTPRAPS